MAGLDPSIGLSGLRAAQRGLEVVGHNLANATTPGYSRQSVELRAARPEDRAGTGQVGTGVQVVAVRRAVDQLLQGRLMEAEGQAGLASTAAGRLSELESLLGRTDEGSLGALLSRFFAGAAAVAASPDDPTSRAGFVSDLRALASGLSGARAAVEATRVDIGSELGQRVADLQGALREVAALDQGIVAAKASGQNPNDLLDRRDVLLRDLSRQAGVRAIERDNGAVTLTLGGEVLLSSGKVAELGATTGADGRTQVTVNGRAVDLTAGELAGLQRAQDTALDLRGRLHELARGLILELNRIDSTGVPPGGPRSSLLSTLAVKDQNGTGDPRDDPLVNAGLPIPPGAGPTTLYVNVTDLATGARTETRISFDPRTGTLGDLAAALSGVSGVTATAGSDGRLTIVAGPGQGIDFADHSGAGGSDQQGVLAALGFGQLLTGSGAADIGVAAGVTGFAAGLGPGAGDGRNAARLAGLERVALPALGGLSLMQGAADLVAESGRASRDAQGLQRATDQALSLLEERRQSASGVSLEDEAADMLRFERAFQASSRYLQVLDGLAEELLGLVR